MADRHEEFLQLLQAVNRGMFIRIKDVLDQYRLPAASMFVMHHIRQEQGITISELSRRTGMAKSHVSKTIDSLVAQNLLTKQPDPADQRLIRIQTTAQTEQHFGQMRAEIHQRLSLVVAVLPTEKLEVIIDGLKILKDILGQKSED